MEGVKSIRQLDDKNLHWRAKIGPKEEEWQAEIMEQIPDQRIAWRSTTGAKNGGVVTFHRLDENTTRIMLQIEYDPEGVVENVGDAMGAVDRRIEGDLKRFKEFIESRQQPTGAWRGEIHGQQVEAGPGQTSQGQGSQTKTTQGSATKRSATKSQTSRSKKTKS
jgi:hypothetical protein